MSSLPKDLKFFGYLNGNLSSNNNNTNSQQESGSDDDSASSNGSSGSNGTRRSNSPPCAATASGTPLPDPFIIGVAGGTASGKTTVCKMIMQQLEGRRVVCIHLPPLPKHETTNWKQCAISPCFEISTSHNFKGNKNKYQQNCQSLSPFIKGCHQSGFLL
eukprot:GEZU01017714.1.p1 GENE.GEZU01017714.1~~GEZU01017714.1.p1  ORF type:complete len:160 (+),score=7.11 GEZU01017714.1:246-725(+)